MIRALSFGTGVFLRGFFIDFAEKAGISVTMASSTPEGDARARRMNAVNGRFVLGFRGIGSGEAVVDTWRIVDCVDRVIPSTSWEETLRLSRDPSFRLIVSNVSEAGFRLADDPKDDMFSHPHSFPARLTRWLYERWQTLGETAVITVLPCELFAENGQRLRTMLDHVCAQWQLPEGFKRYLNDGVRIPNTLVDRIVTGEPTDEEKANLWYDRLGKEIELPIVVAEPFALWAIEGDTELQEQLSSLCEASEGAILVTPNIDSFVLKKVRFLNGLHSAMAVIGSGEYGVETVRQAVEHPDLGPMLKSALFNEILPSLSPPLDAADAQHYAETTWNRFFNPFLHHKLSDINKGATAKWPVRVLPTIATYRERFEADPPVLARCLASFNTMQSGASGD